ncbi:Uncharacterised protein [Mycobacteroides abscessus subsp. abscessus]|nr:Uncharacterised protein [Mycobacteroides abscessus subsp. abscessus]
MRVLCTGVHLQLALDLTAELVLGQHAHDRLLHRAGGELLQLLTDAALAQTARETRVTVSELVGELVAAEGDLLCIDDDDEIATIDVRCEGRLVLAAQQICCLNGKTAEHHIRGVDDVPSPGDVTRLRGVGRHSLSLSTRVDPRTVSAVRGAGRGARWRLISATSGDPSLVCMTYRTPAEKLTGPRHRRSKRGRTQRHRHTVSHPKINRGALVALLHQGPAGSTD